MIETYICKNCEEEFPKTHRSQSKCKPCQRKIAAAKYKLNREKIKKANLIKLSTKFIKCKGCGEDFIRKTNSANQLYCTKTCRLEWAVEKRKTNFKNKPLEAKDIPKKYLVRGPIVRNWY